MPRRAAKPDLASLPLLIPKDPACRVRCTTWNITPVLLRLGEVSDLSIVTPMISVAPGTDGAALGEMIAVSLGHADPANLAGRGTETQQAAARTAALSDFFQGFNVMIGYYQFYDNFMQMACSFTVSV